MSLSKVLLVRLTSSLPLRERCQFAKEICSQTNISLNCKEALVVNWLFDELNNLPSNSALEIWDTLHHILRITRKPKGSGSSQLLKNAFASIIYKHAKELCKCPCVIHAGLVLKMMKCVSHILVYPTTTSIFCSQPDVLLKLLATYLKIIHELILSKISCDELMKEYLVAVRHAVENQLLPYEKILDVLIHKCLEPIITFILHIELQDHEHSVYSKRMSDTLAEWLKATLTHYHLNQSYKQFLKLEDPNHVKIHLGKSVKALMYKIGTMLKSDNSTLVKATAGLMSLILQGMLAKPSQNSLDLPFSMLVHFVKLTPISREEDSLFILNQLLQVCYKNTSLLNKSGQISTADKLSYFREICGMLICSEMPVTPSLFKCFVLLLSLSPNVLDPQLQALWTISLFNSSQLGGQVDFICMLLRTYIRLRQVPKLVSKLVLAIQESISSSTLKDHKQKLDLPKMFLIQFSECIVSLPAGQAFELWQIFLDGSLFLLQESAAPIYSCPIVKLFSALLTHIKICENEFPVAKVKQVNALTHGTQEFVRAVIQQNVAQDSDILSLCYAWGELLLTVKVYQMNLQQILPITDSKVSVTNSLYDLSELHPYLRGDQWTIYLSHLDLSDETVKHSLIHLLIQKTRCMIILNDSDLNDIHSRVCLVASSIFQLVAEGISNRESILCQTSDVLDTFVTWLPLLFPSLSSKNMVRFCQLLFDSMISTWKTENSLTRLVLKSNFFLESRTMQTAFLTCLWGECNNALTSLKRKHDNNNTKTDHIFRQLSKHPKLWQKFSETKLEGASYQDNEMWITLKKLSAEFCGQSGEQNIAEVERTLHLVQLLHFFPLEHMGHGNQMRCVFGLLQLLVHLTVSKHERKSELHVLICQSLACLLSKIPATMMMMLFQADLVLEKVFSILSKSDNNEEEKWSLILLEKLVQVFVNDISSLNHVEQFAKSLDTNVKLSDLGIKALHMIIKRLLSLFKRHIHNVESFQVYDQLTKSLVSNMSKWLLSASDLNRKLVFQCINCILTYHCQVVPTSLETVKRRPSKYLNHHLTTVESLIMCQNDLDLDTAQAFYELVALISMNRAHFEEHLPEKFVLKVWDVICVNMTLSDHKGTAGNTKMALTTISSVMKSLTTEELVAALQKLNTKSNSIMSSHDTSELINFITVWTMMVDTDFADLPIQVTLGISKFLNVLLPLLLLPLDSDKQISDVSVPILKFVSHLLQNNKLPLKHSQVLICFQTCASLKLYSLEVNSFLQLSGTLIIIYKSLLTRVSQVVLQSVAPFISCLSVILKQLVRSGNDTLFQRYNDSTKKELLLCAQDFSKLLAIVANYKIQFSKQAGFLIAEYLSEVEIVTVNTTVKEQLLLGIYKILDICNEHVTAMLQVTLASGGREILKQLRLEFNQNYRYKGRV